MIGGGKPRYWTLDIGAIRFELKKLLGLEADVPTLSGLPPSFQ